MAEDPLYHDGNRKLQDQFDSRRIADRLEEVTLHDKFMPHDVQMIENAEMFFLATADAEGRPDVSYKGGLPGFVRVVSEGTLAFPHYDGNGMFKSLGNVLVNPNVGLLFIDFERPNRMRVQGVASVSADDPLLAEFPGAQLIIRVKAERIFPNCPRYIHRMQLVEHSVYAPDAQHEPPEPDWKHMPVFKEHLPKEGPAALKED
jgi:predicted pyridoxine 5'-phosphate oxidase superfamily flavin-nucleotide-binding protein